MIAGIWLAPAVGWCGLFEIRADATVNPPPHAVPEGTAFATGDRFVFTGTFELDTDAFVPEDPNLLIVNFRTVDLVFPGGTLSATASAPPFGRPIGQVRIANDFFDEGLEDQLWLSLDLMLAGNPVQLMITIDGDPSTIDTIDPSRITPAQLAALQTQPATIFSGTMRRGVTLDALSLRRIDVPEPAAWASILVAAAALLLVRLRARRSPDARRASPLDR